jgi:hypothetical protein
MWALENHALGHGERELRKIEALIRESALCYLCKMNLDRDWLLQRLCESNGLYRLHALNFEAVRLFAESGETDRARTHLRRIFTQTPWFFAKFGKDTIELAERHDLLDRAINDAWQRFRRRLS